ncbi:MAG: cysteine desulfurase [Alphaproteobacteria bacterium]|nr:cysteine desulfurase [Alphaproteobacteria bacterium]
MASDPLDLEGAILSALGQALAASQGPDPSPWLDTAGRAFARRDPVQATDPLPRSEDTAAFSTAAILEGQDPGQYATELIALRGPQAPSPQPVGGARWGGLPSAKRDFPALNQQVNGRPLVWLDSGATTHKPQAVIDAVSRFYARDNSNVHRGAHTLAARATDAYEGARQTVARYLGADHPDEIVFTRGTTESINLVAQSWGRHALRPGDEILLTQLEHHANLVPWQQIAAAQGAILRPIPVDDRGDVRLDRYAEMLSPRVKMVALTQVSNTVGTVLPVAPMAALAHAQGARVLVDGAQSVAHLPLELRCLGADFFAFSGHKIYGPTGIGVLWARRELLEEMPPWQGGGNMIRDVTFERTLYADPPAKFEAGTPNLAGAVGLAAALDYVEELGRPLIASWEHMLLERMLDGLRGVPGLMIVGAPMLQAGSVSFVMDGLSPAAIAAHLDRAGIAIRAGHHCAQPALRRFGYEATARASLGLYNTPEDIDLLVEALRTAPR